MSLSVYIDAKISNEALAVFGAPVFFSIHKTMQNKEPATAFKFKDGQQNILPLLRAAHL